MTGYCLHVVVSCIFNEILELLRSKNIEISELLGCRNIEILELFVYIYSEIMETRRLKTC